MYGFDTENHWWLDANGGHAFSEDGLSWTYSGVAWGDPTSNVQGNLVHFQVCINPEILAELV